MELWTFTSVKLVRFRMDISDFVSVACMVELMSINTIDNWESCIYPFIPRTCRCVVSGVPVLTTTCSDQCATPLRVLQLQHSFSFLEQLSRQYLLSFFVLETWQQCLHLPELFLSSLPLPGSAEGSR